MSIKMTISDFTKVKLRFYKIIFFYWLCHTVILTTEDVTAQPEKDVYYFVAKKDTVFCSELNYGTTAQGYLSAVIYKDMKGLETNIQGRKNVPDVQTFFLNGTVIDKTPLKANKPDGYIRYTERAVDGKLKVYLMHQGHTNGTPSPNSPSGSWATSGPTGIYRFFIQMPNGTFYKINSKKNLNDYIKPYLLKCKEFKSKYRGDFSMKESPFIEMIELYNSVCP